MATRNIIGSIQVRRDTAANWESRNPILKTGEFGYDTTNGIIKIGDGVTSWKSLIGLMKNYITYGVKIDKRNSNPVTSVTYTDDAKEFIAATQFSPGSWLDKFPFNYIRPCLLKNGSVVGYLNPKNYALFEDGTSAPINDRSAGDVMIEIPKCYYKFSSDNNYYYIKISNSPLSIIDGFTDWAFSYKGVVRDRFYIGAYHGNIYNNILYSTSGETPTNSQTIGAFRKAAQAKGDGYEILPYNKLILLQILYLIQYKSLDSQTSVGMGYTRAEIGTPLPLTGETNQFGLYYGTSNPQSRVKCHGIEDLWGVLNEIIEGLVAKDDSFYVADGGFNETASGYEFLEALPSLSITGYTMAAKCSDKLGFINSSPLSGSSSTYYCDYGACVKTPTPTGKIYFPIYGGAFTMYQTAGIFSLDLSKDADTYYSPVAGARLCYCK